jgi:uncharacterized protein YhfF
MANKLNQEQQDFWLSYLKTLPLKLRPKAAFVEAAPAGDQTCTDNLIALYLNGKKTAGSSLVADFKHENDPLPQVGNYWIVLDSKQAPALILKTTSICFNKFAKVPAEIARAEGEGDLSFKYWTDTHAKFFAPYLKTWGVDNLDDAMVVTEYFDLVYKKA